MDVELLDKTLTESHQPAYRAEQVWKWAAKGAAGYDSMTNLPTALREQLGEAVPFSTLSLEREAHSKDGTVKALFNTHDGLPIEAVLMRYRDGRSSICLSSQSGCPLTCTFCATGAMRFGRNLTASEILDQALHFRRSGDVNHAVFMGMGEPLMNLDAVLAACARLPDLGVTNRRTGISTVGWIPGIERLAKQSRPLRLALSLHAADDALRSELMPVNERYPLADVLAACRAFYERKRRRVFVEYVMLDGVNDRPEQARALAKRLDRRVFKINLIPFNPSGSEFGGSPRNVTERFRKVLEHEGFEATVRLTRGRDIDAACGQLAAGSVAVSQPTPVGTEAMNLRRLLCLMLVSLTISFALVACGDDDSPATTGATTSETTPTGTTTSETTTTTETTTNGNDDSDDRDDDNSGSGRGGPNDNPSADDRGGDDSGGNSGSGGSGY